MLIGVPRELLESENRVAATPKTVQQILKLGFDVIVEHDAGFKASFEDQAFIDAGAKIGSSSEVWHSDVIFKVNPPTDAEIDQMKEGATLVSFIWRAQNPDLMKKLTSKKINVLAMDSVPRISRAQALDALSSMANISGYRAVIEAAHEFGSFFTGQITAAGKVPPAKVLVIGAGVAGLAAIGAANSLGAIVRAFDSRPEVKEQVQSMGASFLEIDFKEEGGSGDGYAKVMSEEFNRRAMELYAEQAKEVDIIITTAAIPGKPAPRLITKEMVDSMKPGSVVVDLAAATGGNCAYTEAGKVVTTENQVKIIGYTDFPSRLPTQSSQLYGTNLVNLLKLLCKEKDGKINIDFDDVVLRGVTVVRDGEEIPPAKVLVIGAGVAGLAAIGAANSLGAIVRAFDSRPEVKEQVQSMGASFLEIDFKEEGGSGDGYAKVMSEEFNRRAMELYAEQAKEVDIIITTAAIPGKPAPRLITKEMVDSMKPGSVVVDLAAATGGNCAYTEAGKVVTTENQVKIIGYTDFPSRLPTQSSQLYGTNLVNLLKLLCKEKDGNINIDFDDVVLRGVTVVRDGEEIPPAQIQVSAQPKQEAKAAQSAVKKEEEKPADPRIKYGVMAGVGVLFLWLASVAPAAFLSHFTVFVLACVVGYYVVWNVSHALHTPLMAVTNAISGIIIVGALLQIRQPTGNFFIDALAFVAILVASINIFGGFRVTQRMLAMFRKG